MALGSRKHNINHEKKFLDNLCNWSSAQANKIDLLKRYRISLDRKVEFDWYSIPQDGERTRPLTKQEEKSAVKELKKYVDNILEA